MVALVVQNAGTVPGTACILASRALTPSTSKVIAGQYRGDIDGAIDDYLATLKLEARRLLRECAKESPALRQFHLNFG